MSNSTENSFLSAKRLALLKSLLEKEGIAGSTQKQKGLQAPPVMPVPRDGASVPISYSQQMLWFMEQLNPGSNTYNSSANLWVEGLLDTGVLERTFNEIIRRHENLRTNFVSIDGNAHQVIAPSLRFELPVVDLSDVPQAEWETRAQQLAVEHDRQTFDLAAGALVRITLLRFDAAHHVILLTMHHIITDGWSRDVFFKEMAIIYAAFLEGKPSPLPELAIQCADYALWQREWLQGEVLDEQLAFWKKHLEDAPAVIDLPLDRPRPHVQTQRGSKQKFRLSERLSRELKALGQREGVTMFMLLLAAYKVFLYRYTSQDDILIGTPLANRARPEIEGLIGCLVNTLVLRTNLSGEPTFRELLARVREVTLGAYTHQHLPLDRLMEDLRIKRDLSHLTLFQVMFTFLNDARPTMEFAGLRTRPLPVEYDTVMFDLITSLQEEEDQTLSGEWEYNTDIFDHETITRMMGNFKNLLEGIVADPNAKIAELPLMSEEERRRIMFDWNDTAAEFPRDLCLPQLFEAQVEQTPDALAATDDLQELTYHELNRRANKMAHALVKMGVGADDLVGLFAHRGVDWLTAMLAVFKAGGAYVPLDPAYPAGRLRQVLEQSRPKLVLTSSELAGKLSEAVGLIEGENRPPVREIEKFLKQAGEDHNLAARAQPDNLAYVIFTSGSTGVPKGAMIEHRGMLNHLYAKISDLAVTADDVIAQTASQCFDISVWQFLTALLVGGRVHIINDLLAHDPVRLLEEADARDASIIETVPSMLRAMLDEVETLGPIAPLLASLRWMLVTGEALPPELCRKWANAYAGIPLLNAYGPTECSDDVTHYVIDDPPGEEVFNMPIGRPVANTRLYVLDRHLRPVPVGVMGELYVGGVGVGRGYLGDPVRTAEVFLTDIFSDEPGARLYRTGDRARLLPDGRIEYRGRVDHQVKMRGFRIELGEIEAVLETHKGVAGAVVLMREDEPGKQSLVGYVIAQQEPAPTAAELREYLKERLPDYMIPSAFVTLDELPLTAAGKVDRRALPVPTKETGDTAAAEGGGAYRTPVEEVVAGIWSQVLGAERVGLHDNFFELGGHSLLATQVITRVRTALQVELVLPAIFEAPTVAGLASVIEKLRRVEEGLQIPPIKPVPRNRPLPLSFAQQRIWFVQQMNPDSPTYNIPLGVGLSGKLDLEAMEKSLSEIARRHEILRATIAVEEGHPVQVVSPAAQLKPGIISLEDLPDAEREAEVERLAQEEALRPFDLTHGPLARATLLRLSDEDHILMVTMHHIVSDGWSTWIFVHELAALYGAYAAGEESPLADLPVQYGDFAVWQREWMQGAVLEKQLSYWKTQLEGAPAVTELPLDRPRPPVQTARGAAQPFRLSKELTGALKSLSQRQGATLFMTLLASFKTLLYRYSGQNDIVIGAPIANRNQPHIENIIGFFVNTLVLRTDLAGNPSWEELLGRVRDASLGAYVHQDLPLEKLVEELQPERTLSYNPLFQVVFALQNADETYHKQTPQLSGLILRDIDTHRGITKFDLMLEMAETSQGLAGQIEYNVDLFDDATIERMLRHFETLLKSIVAQPYARLDELEILSTEDELLFRQPILISELDADFSL